MDPIYPFGKCECSCEHCADIPGPAALIIMRDKEVLNVCTRCHLIGSELGVTLGMRQNPDKILAIPAKHATREQIDMFITYDTMGSVVLARLIERLPEGTEAVVH